MDKPGRGCCGRAFRKLHVAQILPARDIVHEWGYPRHVERTECRAGMWYAWGDDVTFWFEFEDESHTVTVHLAMHPNTRGKLFLRPLFEGIEVIAGLLCARGLVVFPLPGNTVVDRYAKAMQFEKLDGLWFKPIGGPYG